MSEKNTYLLKYKDVCRCCLDNPGSKNMWDEYVCNNEREVYGEMISECFGVSWEANNEELICDSCVFRLREAVKLKIEFLAVQELLHENIVLEDGKTLPIIEPKVEHLEEGPDDYISDDNKTVNMDYDSATFEIKNDFTKKSNKRIYKQYTIEDMNKAIEAVTVHGKSMLEAATTFSVPRKTLALRLSMPAEIQEAKDMAEEKKLKLVEEIKTILQNTNAVPFKTKTNRPYCAYCFTDGPSFDDTSELRSHIAVYHKTNYIRDVDFFMRPWYANEILKLDITDLKCTICNSSIDDWNSMFLHFAEVHEVEFDEAYNKVIPFSLVPDNKCVLCYESFKCLGSLDVHMNGHYCNYICYECGDPFLSSTRFDVHLRMHKTEKHPCEKCDKVFASQHHKIKHIKVVHSGKCVLPKDNHPFKSSSVVKTDRYYEMPCEYCGKCFNTSTSLNAHIKKLHIKKRKKSKKNYICGVCGCEFEKFVNLKYHWREHMEMIPFQNMENVTFATV